jgi:hypothetical protein
VLRELEGRSYSDIGERLGMSRPVVESTLFRARRRLAEEYDELASGRRCEFVRKMVDSGPHYSLGIRDRRRIARHFAHCQSCRAHARGAGFDESILNMPSAAAKIAALLPIPLLRARLGAVEHLGASRDRPSLLALRSVHALARSPDQIVGIGAGGGRGAATAAAIVLASVGGGMVTVTSPQPEKTSPRVQVHAAAHSAPVRALGQRAAPRPSAGSSLSGGAGTTSATAARASVTHSASFGRGAAARIGARGSGRGASQSVAPAGAAPTTAAPASSGAGPSGTAGASAPTGSDTGLPVNPTPADSLGVIDPTLAAAGLGPTGTPTPPAGVLPTGVLPTGNAPSTGAPTTGTPPAVASPVGTVTTTVAGVTGALPTLPGAGVTAVGTVAGTVNGVAAAVGGP